MIKKISVLYLSQLCKTVLPLFFVPLTISLLGVEQYGLVTFLAMLIGLLGILDLGISGTFIRQVSISKDNLTLFDSILKVFIRAVILFLGVSFFIFIFFYALSNIIYSHWLNTRVDEQVSIFVIKAMGLILACTYFKSYISSFMQGLEKQVPLAIWNIVYSVLFYAGSYYFVLYFCGNESNDRILTLYFISLSVIMFIDVSVLSLMLLFYIVSNRRTLRNTRDVIECAESETASLRDLIKFAIHLSGLSFIWMVATQVDKVVLSTYARLDAYAHYQIAAQLAMTITMLAVPVSQYLMPRLSSLYKKDNNVLFIKEVSYFIFIFSLFVVPISPYFYIYGERLISVWMGNKLLGEEINAYAFWLVSATLTSVIMNFLFIVLYAMNKIKMHFYAYASYSVLTIPCSIFVAKYYGAAGSAKFLFLHSLIFMLVWGPIGFSRFIRGLVVPLFYFLVYLIFFSYVNFRYMSELIFSSYELIDILLPPLLNIFFITLPLFLFRFKVRDILSRISLKSNWGV